jgi:ferredoxin-type protein NapH
MTALAQTKEGSPRMAIWKAMLLTLPIVPFAASGLMNSLTGGNAQLIDLIAGLTIWILLTAVFFRMLVTGKTHRYRSALFILLGLAVPLYLIPQFFEILGTNMLTPEMTYAGRARFCPMTIGAVILPAVLKGVVIFPGPIAEGAVYLFLWTGASLVLGRGWCSWGCVFGGWDECFSRLRKKAVIKHVDRKWRFLPFAVLLAIVLLSAITLHPIYCEWLCPFKVVSEFEAPVSLATTVALGIFPLTFLGLVVALPLLTKKRIQCGLFCPFGALQSFFNKISIFEPRIDLDKCSQCKRCLRECPTFSLDEGSLVSGKALLSCTRCGQCVDACPKEAMSYHIKGTRIGVSRHAARLLFLYPAYILFCGFGGAVVTGALWRVLRLITTGSMI